MASKKKIENYQTVGQRVLEAFSKLNFEKNIAVKREFKVLSQRYYRTILKENYDKDTTIHKVSRFFVENLHMDYEDFTPHKILDKNHILYMNLGLKKPVKTV